MSDSELLPGESRPEETAPSTPPAAADNAGWTVPAVSAEPTDATPPAAAAASTAAAQPSDGAEAPAPKRRRASMFDDPVVRWMTWIAVGMIVLYAAGIIAAFFFGAIGNTTPRTALERDIFVGQTSVQNGSKDPAVWAAYISALLADGQYAKAQATIDTALKVVDESRGAEITIQQARLYQAKKNYKAAIDASNKAMAIVQKKYDYEMSKNSPSESRALGKDAHYWTALLVKAASYYALGDKSNALAAFNLYLKNNPTDASIFDLRGALRADMGDKAGAKADYQTALKYVPDDARALAGLKAIGASK